MWNLDNIESYKESICGGGGKKEAREELIIKKQKKQKGQLQAMFVS